jgi:phosphate transport system substrate-binding protein
MIFSLLLFIVVVITKIVVTTCHEGHFDGILLLHGSGTTNPSKCYWTILEQFQEQSPIPIHATYRGIGSTNGMKEFAYPFLNNTVDSGLYPNFFGSGDIPVTQEIYNQINNSTFNRSNQFVHIPVLAGTISFFHNVPNITNLNLTACILSQIYTQQITTWDDEQILNINPEIRNQISNLQGLPITSIHRLEGSSSTHAATNVRAIYIVIVLSVDVYILDSVTLF